MITKIQLKNVSSYSETPVVLETDKRINLIYGLNGTGKTTLSNYLQNKDNGCFSECSISFSGDEKILVYNENFIKNNFYQDTQKGIFSLSAENKQAKEKIDLATKKIIDLEKQIKNDELKNGYHFDLKKKQTDIENLRSDSEEKIWEIKNNYYGGDRILEFCLVGKVGSKKDLFDYISKLDKPLEKPRKTIDELKKEAEATQGENAQSYNQNLVKKIDFDFSKIENNEIFKEVIIGNENSQVAELINKLNNSDWVKKGTEFLNEPRDENETCPFCQQKTISKKLYHEIKNYFDETYKTKIESLKKLYDKYSEESQVVKKLETELLKIDFIKNKEKDFKLLFNNFITKVDSNLSKISHKINHPNIIIDLQSSISEKKALNDFLDAIIIEITIHNEKIKNKQKTKEQIINDFWGIMRLEYDQTVENYTNQLDRLQKEKNEIEAKIAEVNRAISEQKKIIEDAQKETINIQDAIDAINTELIYFGLDGFSVVPAGENSYKLKRPNEDIAKFETLSEGEKTVISFLYFLELCKGKESPDEITTKKIVVIDDPISSLSHMYVFNVAQLIRSNFFNNNYEQVFVLTHNLYFYHELLHKQKDQNVKLFRLSKSDYSQISTISRNEIQNEYESYWQILKDYENGKATTAIMANAMRNILERFFGFIGKDDFYELTKKIESSNEGKYKFFIRYINKESHSDPINISDSKEIDPEIFKEAFKTIFIDYGYEEHYNKMMN
jgi:wobble nucleotide-excising tRNase